MIREWKNEADKRRNLIKSTCYQASMMWALELSEKGTGEALLLISSHWSRSVAGDLTPCYMWLFLHHAKNTSVTRDRTLGQSH